MPRFDPDTYESVEERLQRFWAEHPEGRIFTQLISSADVLDQTVVRAEVYFDHTDQFPRGTGLAFETRGGSGANATSHLENCETSAIGRALANCNYKARRDSARPSQEEMRKVHGPEIGREPIQRGPLLPNGSPREQVTAPAPVVEGAACPECNAPAGKPHTRKCSALARPADESPVPGAFR